MGIVKFKKLVRKNALIKTIEKGFSNLNELMEVQSKVQTLLKTLFLINELDKESFQFIIDTLIKESKWRKIDSDHYECNECDYWTFEKTYFARDVAVE